MVDKSLVLPSRVKNLKADAKNSNVVLSCDDISNLQSIVVYRSQTNDIATAVLQDTAQNSQVVDNDVTPGDTYFYWAATADIDGNIDSDWSHTQFNGLQATVPLISGQDTDPDSFIYFEKNIDITPTTLIADGTWYLLHQTSEFDGYDGVIEVYLAAYLKMNNIESMRGVNVEGLYKTAFQEETSPGVWTTLQESAEIVFIQAISPGGNNPDYIRADNIIFSGYQTGMAGKRYRGQLLYMSPGAGAGADVQVYQIRELVKVHKTAQTPITVSGIESQTF